MTQREFDLAVFGATGFTGQLVAKYLAARPARLALVGRSRAKLEAVARTLGRNIEVVVADALDRAACDDIALRTRGVCTTVGPYAKYGSELVAACAAAGTHYCDLTGEVHWMRAMIDAHHETARRTGARIVHACGFDSIPSDLGTWATQQAFIARFGHPASSITALFGEARGGVSGGTAASAFGIAEAMTRPDVRRTVGNPYGLDPDPDAPHPPAPDTRTIGWDKRLGMFTAPFVMGKTNSRVVRRSHALAGFPWGHDFVYREMMSAPGTARGLALAIRARAMLSGLSFALRRPKLRAMLQARAPKPGEGPAAAVRERGHWKYRFVAERRSAGVSDEGQANRVERLIYTVADPHGDPGYASTAKMLGEAAMCLAFDPLSSPGGVLTPSVAMGAALVERLRAAGLTFAVQE